METIVKIKKRDLKKCATLLKEAYKEAPYNERFEKDFALRYIQTKYKFGKNYSFVIKINHKIVGFVFSSLSYWSNGPQIIIEEIVIDKIYRNKGYAKRLMIHLENQLKKEKIKSALLWVKKSSPAFNFHKANLYKEAKDIGVMFKRFD